MKKMLLSGLIISFACLGEIDTTLLKKCNLPTNEPVIVFTAPWCGACQEFKDGLREANIHYHEINAEASDANMASMDCIGGEYYPYVVVEGEVVDYDDDAALDKALTPYAHR